MTAGRWLFIAQVRASCPVAPNFMPSMATTFSASGRRSSWPGSSRPRPTGSTPWARRRSASPGLEKRATPKTRRRAPVASNARRVMRASVGPILPPTPRMARSPGSRVSASMAPGDGSLSSSSRCSTSRIESSREVRPGVMGLWCRPPRSLRGQRLAGELVGVEGWVQADVAEEVLRDQLAIRALEDGADLEQRLGIDVQGQVGNAVVLGLGEARAAQLVTGAVAEFRDAVDPFVRDVQGPGVAGLLPVVDHALHGLLQPELGDGVTPRRLGVRAVKLAGHHAHKPDRGQG